MEKYNLDEYIKGWFVGNFSPTIHATDDFEVAIKRYKSGDKEKKHYHKIAQELTVIVSGHVRMNGVEYKENDIIKISPLEISDFEVIQDTVTVVVKYPSVKNDKYEVS